MGERDPDEPCPICFQIDVDTHIPKARHCMIVSRQGKEHSVTGEYTIEPDHDHCTAPLHAFTELRVMEQYH
jgi:hypothetical protein